MRVLILALTAAIVAGPAMAQVAPQLGLQPFTAQDSIFLQQQEATRQQLIQQQNQIMSLDAQIRAQQALSDVQAQARVPQLPLPDVTPGRPLPQIDTSQLASIPDAALADSNKKVLEAAGNRR
jgi:hypothetical protein